jgi:hypothetical protein
MDRCCSRRWFARGSRGSPMAWSGVRSLLKGVVKGSITVYETGRELVEDAVEGTADLIEEARSEVQSELSAAWKTVKASKRAKS